MAKGFNPFHVMELEQVVLGSMMISGAVRNRARETLEPEFFWHLSHADIFTGLCKHTEEGTISPFVLARELFSSEDLSGMGGMKYLKDIYSGRHKRHE